jgi:ABC-type amino acid transport system permease subunit
MSFINILQNYSDAFASGILVTLKLALIIWFSGVVIGSLLGMVAGRSCFFGGLVKTIAIILAAMPALVFMFWLHYPLQSMLKVVIDPFITAALTLSIINIFMVADLVKNTIAEFPKQYDWAAKVCGLSEHDTNFKIRLPIIFRQIMPNLLTIQITMLQATLFASLISVDEIFRVSQQVNSLVYKPVEIYTMLALLFIAICVPLHLLANYLKNKYTRNLSER